MTEINDGKNDPHPYATPVREITRHDGSGTRRFVFTYAPRDGKPYGRRLTIEVTPAQWQEIETLATPFEMRTPFFLRLLVVTASAWVMFAAHEPLIPPRSAGSGAV